MKLSCNGNVGADNSIKKCFKWRARLSSGFFKRLHFLVSIFVSFEGIDGCGKTTQVELLRSRLESAGARVLATREPGGTALAEMLRASILTSDVRLDAPAEALLFGAARAQHVVETIRPALERGDVVLCDRFADSSVAYQGAGLGLELDFIERLNRFATGGLQPHITFLLDLDPATGWQRRETQRGTTPNSTTTNSATPSSTTPNAAPETDTTADVAARVEDTIGNPTKIEGATPSEAARRGEEDRIERRGLAFQERVRNAFLQLAQENPDRIVVLDAAVPAKIVHNRIVRELAKRELFRFDNTRSA